MKILLIGEYSNVHATLAQGLRSLGHHVVVASNGDFWKYYPRDLDWARSGTSRFAALRLMAKICSDLPRLRGFDIVQFINPVFAELKAERLRPFYRYLRRHNKRVILCAMGMDWFWVHTCTHEKPLRYSDFNIGAETRTNADAVKEQKDWLGTAKGQLNKFIARDCDGIVAGLYDYYVCYKPAFPEKTVYIPLPIHSKPEMLRQLQAHPHQGPLRLFIGINESRSEYKGTDIMLRAAEAHAATPFMALLLVFSGVLHRWSGQSDVVVGVPVSVRDEASLDGVVGMLVNTVPVRVARLRGRDGVAGPAGMNDVVNG